MRVPNGRPFRECVLHIGTEKTGTTSLQKFLKLNRDALRDRGWFVPETLAPYAAHGFLNHIFLATVSRDPAAPSAELAALAGFAGPVVIAHHVKAVTERLRSEIRDHAGGAANLLLSNEHLHSRIDTIADVRRLQAFLAPFCDRVRVLAYLRPQHEVANGLFNTALRNGGATLRLLPDFATENGADEALGANFAYFDYAALLDRYARVFGEDAILPRLYAPAELRGGDVVSDILDTLGIEPAGLELPRRENRSFDADGQRFLLALNRRQSGGATTMRGIAVDVLAITGRGPGLLPARRDLERFQGQFVDSNEMIRRRWFPGRRTLFDIDVAPFPIEADDATPRLEIVLDQLARIFEMSGNYV